MRIMKKLLICSLLGLGLIAEAQVVSFESSEGFVLGDINGQNGWVTNQTDGGQNLPGQLITDEQASDGEFSLKLTHQPDYPGQQNPVYGAYFHPETPVELIAGTTFSYDIFLSERNSDASIYIFGAVNLEEAMYNFYMMADYAGNVVAMAHDETQSPAWINTGADVLAGQWHHIQVTFDGTELIFELDDTEILRALPVHTAPIDEFRFSHDNFGGFAYIDNFRINGESLSAVDVVSQAETLRIYPNPAKNIIHVELPSIWDESNVKIIITTADGRKAAEFTGNRNLDISALPAGIYFVTAVDGDRKATGKMLVK